jgi:hypothetical protein
VPTYQVNPVLLLAPAFLIGAYAGYRRGWQREAITAAGVALAIILLWSGPGLLLGLTNGILERVWRVVLLVIGGDPRRAPPQVSVSPSLEPIVTLALLALMAVLAYLAGNYLGRRFGVDRSGRWYGALVGGLTLFTLMSRIIGTLAAGGPTPPGVGGLNIQIPSFPGLTIVVPPPPDSALLVGWPLAALVFLVVSMLVYALVRMARA